MNTEAMRTVTNRRGQAFAVLATAAAIMTMALPCLAQGNEDRVKCRVEGQVVDDPECKMFLLLPEEADIRVTECDTIMVNEDGRFAYDLTANAGDPYEIVADNEQSAHYEIHFLAENGTVSITKYPFETDIRPVITSEAPLNKEMQRVEKENYDRFFDAPEKERTALEESGNSLTPEAKELRRRMSEAENDSDKQALRAKVDSLIKANRLYTPEYMAAEEKYRNAFKLSADFLFDYAKGNVTPVGLYYLKHITYMTRFFGDDFGSRIAEAFNNVYATEYAGNAMSRYMRNWIASREIRPGGRFIDFSAPDLDGKRHTLSEEISGKVALIDFWASWCGPCRRNSMSMIPVYETWRDRGFTIVGIARERGNDSAMRKAIERDGYPWLNLIELDDRTMIWERYGIGNGGGGTVLVDRDGTILAVNPKAEEVREILESRLSGR